MRKEFAHTRLDGTQGGQEDEMEGKGGVMERIKGQRSREEVAGRGNREFGWER